MLSARVVISVTIAAHDSSWCSCLHRAKMARTMRGWPTAWSQQEGIEEPDTNPSVSQQEEHPYATKGKVIADYDPDVDSEGSEPMNDPDGQEKKVESSDEE